MTFSQVCKGPAIIFTFAVAENEVVARSNLIKVYILEAKFAKEMVTMCQHTVHNFQH